MGLYDTVEVHVQLPGCPKSAHSWQIINWQSEECFLNPTRPGRDR